VSNARRGGYRNRAVSPLACDSAATSTGFYLEIGGGATGGLAIPELSPILQARVTGFDRREMIPDRMLRKLLSPQSRAMPLRPRPKHSAIPNSCTPT